MAISGCHDDHFCDRVGHSAVWGELDRVSSPTIDRRQSRPLPGDWIRFILAILHFTPRRYSGHLRRAGRHRLAILRPRSVVLPQACVRRHAGRLRLGRMGAWKSEGEYARLRVLIRLNQWKHGCRRRRPIPSQHRSRPRLHCDSTRWSRRLVAAASAQVTSNYFTITRSPCLSIAPGSVSRERFASVSGALRPTCRIRSFPSSPARALHQPGRRATWNSLPCANKSCWRCWCGTA